MTLRFSAPRAGNPAGSQTIERRRPAAVRGDACATCGGRSIGLCQPLDAEALDELLAGTDQVHSAAHSVIFRQGEPAKQIYSVVEGTVKLTRLLPNGKQVVLGFRFPGDLIGYTNSGEYGFDAEVLTDARLCRLSHANLQRLMEKRPVLRHRMLDLCAAELGEAQDRLVSVGRFNAEAKVATFLLSLLAAAARRGKAGVMLDMPMTRADIADFLGLSLETVSRVFTLFSKRGWQNEPAHHKVVLRDIPALTELADGATA